MLAAAPAAALGNTTTTTETATSGTVSAAFSFQGSFPDYRHQTLQITRSGQVVYSQPVTARLCGEECDPASVVPRHLAIHVVDLEHNGQPDVVLDLFSGGAHCCTIEQVFSFDRDTGSYLRTQRDFGDPGAQLVDLRHNRRFEFLTADDSFAYRFTDFADSGLPIEIFTFADRRFTNVTRRYPKLIAKDAAAYLSDFKHDLVDGDGLIAAWAADEDNLGHTALVASTLATELKAGDLRSPNYASGQKFIAALNRFLRHEGYVH